MRLSIIPLEDHITPALQARLRVAQAAREIHEAMGLALISVTKQAFTNASFRQTTWAPLYGGAASNLYKSGTLQKSVRVISATATSVQIGSDRHYAAIHQFGGIIRAKPGGVLKIPGIGYRKKVTIPARPYFPFYQSGKATPTAISAIFDSIEKSLDSKK